jgi:bifunctional DNA-binding transcriptional regulator/antitoxin component of YhaV-PrlF toxin-antitoxin module
MSAQRFRTTLQLHGRTATGISVPPDVVEALGAGKRPPVRVTVQGANGSYSYRSTVAPMGGQLLVPVSAEHRKAAGVAAGDELEVQLEHDTEPRVVEVPADLATALDSDPEARRFFDSLSPSHQRAYTDWVKGAKKPETRSVRVTKAAEMLRDGRKR